MRKMRKGAASFYIVAFSTLILMIVATSFAMVIISEITRSMNDDLSQSAYDSALAGVEDAKVAYSNYRRCKEAGATASESGDYCQKVMYWMEHPNCQMVANILGRPTVNGEVELGGTQTTSGGGVTTTNQAYTCVKINTKLSDYRATLTANNKVQTIRAAVGDGPTNNVSKIKIGWYTVRNDLNGRLKYNNFPSDAVKFSPLPGGISLPPTLEMQILQTAPSFSLDDFDIAKNNQTNRATLYLVPTETNVTSDGNNHYHTNSNTLTANDVLRTNSHNQTVKPYTIHCPRNASTEFYCEATIELPSPVGGGDRSNETFMISVSLPYQQPDTDFSIALYCDNGLCGRTDGSTDAGRAGMLKNTQISIDSTGRANDLFRRVETRLETSDTTYASGYPYYALEILGNSAVEKKMTVYYEIPQFYF